MDTLKPIDLLHAGTHLGHLTRYWNPKMAPYIFTTRQGMHLMDVNQTIAHLQQAMLALKGMTQTGKKVWLVATKKQAKTIVEKEARRIGMPYVTERWLGGMLTNFATIRKLLKKLSSLNQKMKTTAYKNMAKKEQLMMLRERNKLTRLLQGISDVTRLPAAIFVVDINQEHVAISEARKLGIPIVAITDTNTNPNLVTHPIPSNDDAVEAIALIVKAIGKAIEAGVQEAEKAKAQPQATEAPSATDQEKKPEAGKPKRTRIAQKITVGETIGTPPKTTRAATSRATPSAPKAVHAASSTKQEAKQESGSTRTKATTKRTSATSTDTATQSIDVPKTAAKSQPTEKAKKNTPAAKTKPMTPAAASKTTTTKKTTTTAKKTASKLTQQPQATEAKQPVDKPVKADTTQ